MRKETKNWPKCADIRAKPWKAKIGQAWRRIGLRTWPAWLNGRAVARYVFLTVAGVVLYKLGAAYALRERGYHAIGGEALALLLPVLYYCGAATVRDWKDGR